jgi:hypothetical protein
MEKVDSYIEDICGLNSEDIPDFNYYDYWESGMTAKRTANSGLDSLLTKEVEALDTKAKRMESVGKQLESGAKLSNASVDYRDGNTTKTLDNEKDAGKLITEIAQIAQKVL